MFGDIARVVSCLAKGDERLQLISTAIAGALPFHLKSLSTINGDDPPSESSQWRNLCLSLSKQVTEPYLRALFTLISTRSWSKVLEDSSLSIKDRLCIALRFLDDQALTTYLFQLAESVKREANIEGLLLLGITEPGMELLRAYLDHHGDLQTVAILTCYGITRKLSHDARNWIEEYRELLHHWKLFLVRARFDVGRGHLQLRGASYIGRSEIPLPIRQFHVRCSFCKSIIEPTYDTEVGVARTRGMTSDSPRKATICPRCSRPLPRCAICLLPLGTIETSPFEKWFSVCLNCNHSTHAGHARDWFSKHRGCPVPGCKCECGFLH